MVATVGEAATETSSAAAGGDPKTWEGAAEDLTPLKKKMKLFFLSFFSSDYLLNTRIRSHQLLGILKKENSFVQAFSLTIPDI